MSAREGKTATEAAAERLREIVLAAPEGALIGGEEALIAAVGASRSTVRQAARLLEREGLLRVRRGLNGGYFGARPNAGTIEDTVSTYLQTLDVEPSDLALVASALWVEAARKAAGRPPAETGPVIAPLAEALRRLPADAAFERVRELELQIQSAVFTLVRSAYVKLIFDVNMAFSRRRLAAAHADDDNPGHTAFVARWRRARLMELDAIAGGDPELAAMAARHSRRIWDERVIQRFPDLNPVAT